MLSSYKNTIQKIQKAELVFLIVSIGLFGLYQECFAALGSIVLTILLLLKVRNSKQILIPKNILHIGICLLPLFAIITLPFAIDRGMALLGFVKFLPAALFVLLIYHEDDNQRERLITILPDFGTIFTAITLLSKLTPAESLFYIQDRFSGIFQYANAYAIFLLVCILITVFDLEKYRLVERILYLGILTIGLFATGCRAALVLMLAALCIWFVSKLLEKKDTRSIKSYLAVIPIILGAAAMYAFIAYVRGDLEAISRFTKYGFKYQSFTNRLTFYSDGLSMLLKHPFGLGYKGFQFYQGEVQSKEYAVTYVHNDLLQAALDFGIIIAIVIFIGFILNFIRKDLPLRNKVILGVFAIHGLFDWDFQFIVLIMILVLITGDNSAWVLDLEASKRGIIHLARGIAVLITAVCLWIGSATFMEWLNNNEAACKIYPGLTTSQMAVISSTTDESKKYELAESICKRSDNCTIALQAMAEKSARLGNYDAMAAYGRKAMLSAKYNKAGYELYLYMLSYAVGQADAAGNADAAYKYLTMVAEVGDLISDKPKVKLSDEYMSYIRQAQEIVKVNQN